MPLSYNRWCQIMGLHPWHAHQLADQQIVPVSSRCNTLIYERASVSADRVGRAEIRQAIAEAERLIRAYAGFWPTPRQTEYTFPYPRLADRRLERLADVQADGRWLAVMLPDRAILAVGPEIEQATATVSLTYADLDNDGLAETATATLTVPAGTQPDQVRARFLAADCGPVDPPEIEPRRVAISGTTATIRFDSWTLVRPILTAGYAATALDPTVLPPNPASPFATGVQAFRRATNYDGTTTDAAQAVLIWETRPPPACCASSDPAALATAIARVTLRNANAGIVAIGEALWDPDTASWSAGCPWREYEPDRITIRYRSGVADGSWDVTVARLAAAILARPVCACDGANREIYEWQVDLARTGATNELYQAPATINNPLGTRRGHLYAWSQIARDQRYAGISAG